MHIQKRTIIAAIITIIVAASTYKTWFVYEPMQVDIKLSIPVKYQVQVLLNKKDNNDFIKEKHETVVVPAGKNQKITFRVKRSRYPKRLKFIFYTEKDSELLPIKLGNITLKKGEYKLEKLNSFTAKNASLKIYYAKIHEQAHLHPVRFVHLCRKYEKSCKIPTRGRKYVPGA